MSKVLLIEDEPVLASALRRVLEVDGHEVFTAIDSRQGLVTAGEGDFQVVVTDLKMPGLSGMEVVKSLHNTKPHLPVILMTGHHTTEIAIEAMKFGAYDYILKPPDPEEFLALIDKAAASSRLMSEPVENGVPRFPKDTIIGNSRAMQNIFKEIGRAATMPVTVLIRGETGTGKELVARAIYQHGDRSDRPFIVVNCVAIPANLLESELFGHEAGSFTDAKTQRIGRFEQANQGTIFLDEIGDMSEETQAKLLRVLQERTIQRIGGKDPIPVDVRVLAATHRDLEEAIVKKNFRADLYHRLNEVMIRLPPLRDRTEDIPPLVNYFMKRQAAELHTRVPTLVPEQEVVDFLQTQPWAGNVRELKNVLQKAVLAARGYAITPEIIHKAMEQTNVLRIAPETRASNSIETELTLTQYVAQLLAAAARGESARIETTLIGWAEREIYKQAIRLSEGDQSKAALWLGVTRPTMRDKLLRYGLHPQGKDLGRSPQSE